MNNNAKVATLVVLGIIIIYLTFTLYSVNNEMNIEEMDHIVSSEHVDNVPTIPEKHEKEKYDTGVNLANYASKFLEENRDVIHKWETGEIASIPIKNPLGNVNN